MNIREKLVQTLDNGQGTYTIFRTPGVRTYTVTNIGLGFLRLDGEGFQMPGVDAMVEALTRRGVK